MKLRTDFVTNSSSSSFVFAYKEPDEDSALSRAFVNGVQAIIENYCGIEGSIGKCFETIDELNEYYIRNNGISREGNIVENINSQVSGRAAEIYRKCAEAINAGFIVVKKEIDYDDYLTCETIKAMCGDYVRIIDEED